MKIRLNKYIAESGFCSRRHADELISNNKVIVNDRLATELGMKIDPTVDKVTIKGKEIRQDNEFVYYAFFKPKGVISTAEDESGRSKVTDFVPKCPRVFPIGRLDSESEGLMILTNDGELTQKLTHPSFEHEKEYVVIARIMNKESRIKENTEQTIKRNFLEGVTIDSQTMKADSVHITLLHDSCFMIHMVLHTGLNRQIRRMCAKMGLEVTNLVRVRIGKLRLEDLNLQPGEYKTITKNQII